MKRIVNLVQAAALLCALAFVVLLFANEPDKGGTTAAPTDEGAVEAAVIDGAAVFANRCASCHGRAGGGGLGPQLSKGRVVARFPDIADQVAVITNGRGGMPGFGTRLSAEEIEAVAEYVRSL